ncbi:hypothetical protein M0R45_019519 [Rubus argutus]|uniref:Uncharacterized protein n=1 Tax=Rubus argutus TaxID=59490 RepID=A0AAW1X5J6_RUBAR
MKALKGKGMGGSVMAGFIFRFARAEEHRHGWATRSAGCRRWRDLGLLLGTAVKEETPAELLEATDIGGLGFAASKWHRTLASMVKVQLAGFGFGLPWSGAGEQQRCAAWMGFAKAREQPCDGSGD